MERNNIKNRFGWISVSLLLLLATACSDSVLDTAGIAEPKTSVVTFTVNTESQTVSTRAAGEGEETDASAYHISDGTHIDVLKYAVYQVTTNANGDTILTLDKSFGKANTIGKVTAGENDGQRLLAATPDKFPMKISLSLDMDKTYKVAFWAQNSNSEAYDTHDLEQVKVNYANAANNDELRDAFCALSDTIDKLSEHNQVTLRRPLAQVNVGTTGWDYEGAAILKPSSVSYTESKITLTGVADTYNVLTGKASASTNNLTAEFAFARIPAFIHVSEESAEWQDADEKYLPFGEKEEYLKVELNGTDGYTGYYGWDDYQDYKKNNAGNIPDTETFKYLSMCYVLVPEAKPLTSEDGVSNATYGSVLDNVTFSAQGIDDVSGPEMAGIGEVFKLNHVPVQKNWRTNILGNNFFFVDQKLNLTIVTDYYGDYNYYGSGKEEDNQEDEVHEIWFDDYSCGNNNDQYAYESYEYIQMLSHGYNLPEGPSWHKHDLNSYTSVYDGKAVGKVLKMQGKTGVAMKIDEESTITIVQAIRRNHSTMPVADGTLLFYKKLDDETFKESSINGITLLETTSDLISSNNTYITSYFKSGTEPASAYFKRLDVDNATETNDYSATTTVYSEVFYDGQTNTNTSTYENVRIYKILIKTPGTYILRNGGKYKPGTKAKVNGKEMDEADESGLAYIKIQKGDHRQETVEDEVDWDKWQKKENPDYKEPEDKSKKQ